MEDTASLSPDHVLPPNWTGDIDPKPVSVETLETNMEDTASLSPDHVPPPSGTGDIATKPVSVEETSNPAKNVCDVDTDHSGQHDRLTSDSEAPLIIDCDRTPNGASEVPKPQHVVISEKQSSTPTESILGQNQTEEVPSAEGQPLQPIADSNPTVGELERQTEQSTVTINAPNVEEVYQIDRRSGTELIMSYRDVSSSSSSDDSSLGEGPAASGSSDDEDVPQKKGPTKVNGERPQRRTSKDGAGMIKTKGELQVEDLPPLDDLHIEVDDTVVLHEAGNVTSVVGVLVIIKGQKDVPALNADTILFTEDRKVLGQVFEIFGPVASPLYSIRFNTTQQLEDRGVKVGLPVFFAPRVEEYTHYVFMEQLRRLKGSDASWEHNNEPPPQYVDYSDDDEERRAKARQRGRGDVSTGENGEQQPQGKKKRSRNQKRNRRGGHQDDNGTRNGEGVPSNIQSWPPDVSGHRNFQGSHRPAYRPPFGNPFGQPPPHKFPPRGRGYHPQGRGRPDTNRAPPSGQYHYGQHAGPNAFRNQPPQIMGQSTARPPSNGHYFGHPGMYPRGPPMGQPLSVPYPSPGDSVSSHTLSPSPPPGVTGAPVSYGTVISTPSSQVSWGQSHNYCPTTGVTSVYVPPQNGVPSQAALQGQAPGVPQMTMSTTGFGVPQQTHMVSPPGVTNPPVQNRSVVDMRYVQNAVTNTGQGSSAQSTSPGPPQGQYLGRPPPPEFGGVPSFQRGAQFGWLPPR